MTAHTQRLGRNRDRAIRLVQAAPDGHWLKIEPPKRTLDQNAKLWACLTDISVSKPEGRCLTPDEWKSVFMSACGWEVQFLEGLDGRPFPVGFRSSKMNTKQMADLITFILAKGDEWGVKWSDEIRDSDAMRARKAAGFEPRRGCSAAIAQTQGSDS